MMELGIGPRARNGFIAAGTAVAVLAGGGCASEAPLSPESMSSTELAKAYTDLGIVGINSTVVDNLGVPLDQLTADVKDRTTLIPDLGGMIGPKSPEDKTVSPQDSLTPSEDYRLPSSPDSDEEGVWSVELPGEDDTSGEDDSYPYLPIAKVALEGSDMVAVDLRPPELRQATADVDNTFTDLVEHVVTPDAGVLRRALAEGYVSSYFFGYDSFWTDQDTAPSSFADYDTNRVVTYLTNDGNETHEETRATVLHETAHEVMFRSAASEANPEFDQSKDARAMRTACRQVRDMVLSDTALSISPDVLDKLGTLREYSPDRRNDINRIIQALYGYTDFRPMQLDGRDVGGYLDQPECTISSPNAMMGTLYLRAGEKPKKRKMSEREGDLWMEVQEAFSTTLRATPVEQTITEHGYSLPGSMGHPEDGYDEIVASLFTVATMYPDEFMDKLEFLDYDQAKAVISLYLAAKAMFTNVDPEFAQLMPNFDFTPWGIPASANAPS